MPDERMTAQDPMSEPTSTPDDRATRITKGRAKHGVGLSEDFPGNVCHLISPIVGRMRLRERDGLPLEDLAHTIDRLSLVLDMANEEAERALLAAHPEPVPTPDSEVEREAVTEAILGAYLQHESRDQRPLTDVQRQTAEMYADAAIAAIDRPETWFEWLTKRDGSIRVDLAPDSAADDTGARFCLCGIVDDRGDGTCGNCGRKILADDTGAGERELFHAPRMNPSGPLPFAPPIPPATPDADATPPPGDGEVESDALWFHLDHCGWDRPHSIAEDVLTSDWLADRDTASKAEALREAAEAMAGGQHSCFRPQGCVECGRQKERDGRAQWLRDRADQIEARP